MYGIKDNADLKAYSVPAHVNPGLENYINKLITQYFCTCVIPFVMPKCTVGERCGNGRGNQGVLWGSQRRDRFYRRIHCPIVCMHLGGCVCLHVPASIFNARVFVCSLI